MSAQGSARTPAGPPRAGSRVALVTGGASGIGWAIARALLANGDRVVVLDRDSAAVARLSVEPATAAGSLTAVVADAGSAEGAALGVQTAISTFQRLDIL